MNVLLVDDHALFREGLELLLLSISFPDRQKTKIVHAGNCKQALDFIQAGSEFDFVLLDLNMPGQHGLDALITIRQVLTHGRIVVLSGEQDFVLINACIDNGASGFVSKESTTHALVHAFKIILTGGVYIPQHFQVVNKSAASSLTNGSTISDAYPTLTPRQSDVLSELIKGYPNKIIARKLNIAEDTVKQHISAIFLALGIKSRTEALYLFSQKGIRIST